jgi:protoporphyrinogen oxidase
MNSEMKVAIVGAGVAGLVAAIELEKAGIAAAIYESTDKVGGRVKTDCKDGYRFDHGFQVLLTAYPELGRYLDMEKLQLQRFRPGSVTYVGSRALRIVDPIRQPSGLFTAMFSAIGSPMDKWRIWRLSSILKQTTIKEIFNRPSTRTIDYLREKGFSERIIKLFFRPFFSGIFLEKDLKTSSRLFEFIFKMFSEGYAAIPKMGMQAIPDQLFGQLKKTDIHFNSPVKSIADGRVTTARGVMAYDAVVIAAEPHKILTDYQGAERSYESTLNLYFKAPQVQSRRLIGLFTDPPVNNIAVLSDVASDYSPIGESLISVSLIDNLKEADDSLVEEVKNVLSKSLKIKKDRLHLLQSFYIPRALPEVSSPSMHLDRDQVVYEKGVYLAGDYLLGGSINGAMLSGRRAAEELLADFMA